MSKYYDGTLQRSRVITVVYSSLDTLPNVGHMGTGWVQTDEACE